MKIHTTTTINAIPEQVWPKIIDMNVPAFEHPLAFRILGIPKPLFAEVISTGVGGRRVAHFSGGKRFTQVITIWEPGRAFGFTFEADPGFRVAHFLDLDRGPFRLVSGSYELTETGAGTSVTLSSEYQLQGSAKLARLPITSVLRALQRTLLRGIKRHSETNA